MIDDYIIYALENEILPSGGTGFNLEHFIKIIKDALYYAVISNPENFFNFLSKYNFPEIVGKEKDFIKDILIFIENTILKIKSNESNSVFISNQLMLYSFLENCIDINELMLFSDKSKTPLIQDFCVFYQTKMMRFKHSQHIFDQEPRIERILSEQKNHHSYFSENISYSFMNSKEVKFIQVSDDITGIIREYYTFI